MGQGGSQAFRLAGNLILTRLLVPELFGLMALVNTFIVGVSLFSDIGIRPSIIRSPRWNDPVFLNTAWTLQVIRGCWMWIGSCLIAWPVSQFYEDSRLLWLLPMVGLSLLIGGFNSTSLAVLNRKLELRTLTQLEIATQLISLVVMIVWAYFYPSVWALIAGNLLSSVLKMGLSHRLGSRMAHRIVWEKEAVQEIISFGRWIFVSTAMTFLAWQADRLILGRLFSLEMLGIYTVAFTMADFPRQIIQKMSRLVMFPIISQYIHLERSQLRAKILKKRWLIVVGLAGLITMLAGFGDLIIDFLYDERYEAASWMLPILAVGLWPLLLSASIERSLEAIGQPKFLAFGNFSKFIYMVLLLPFAYDLYSVFGAVIVVAFNDVPVYIAVNYGLWKENLTGMGQDFQATILLIIFLSIVLIGRKLLGLGLPIESLL